MFIYSVFILFLLLRNAELDEIYIGAMFGGKEDDEMAFKFAIDKVNNNSENMIMSIIESEDFKDAEGPYKSMLALCNLLNLGVVSMFGPSNMDNIDIVQSILDEKEIPHVLNVRNYRSSRGGTILNMYPHPPLLSKAYIDIIRALEWKTYTILYEDDEGLTNLFEVLKESAARGILVNVKQLDKDQSGNYRPVLKEVKASGQTAYLLDCHIDHLKEILSQIQQVGLINSDFKYFITNLDAHTEDLSAFQYAEANITGIRIINPESTKVQEISKELYKGRDDVMLPYWHLRTETAMIIDAVNMLAKAFQDVNAQPWVNQGNQCNATDSWEFGHSVINLMKTGTYHGLTGMINFNHEGFRSDFELEIYELIQGAAPVIGSWNASSGINITRKGDTLTEDDDNSLRNKTFTVITALTEPYGMLKVTHEVLTGNDRFEGFGIELIHELSLMEGFNYTFIIREDKSNDKMLQDVNNHVADLAIADLTITSSRAGVCDFTTPFMNLGISILFRKPSKAPPSFFSFADPFAIETWIGLSLAFFVVTISLYIMGRLCPDEWTNPYPCIEEPEFLVNQWSLLNSFWFSIGGLMQQGSEIAPIGTSTRIAASVWWFFILIMVSSYTANLAAFLATENPIELFTDISSLVENAPKYKIRYGAKAGGATETFFKESSNPVYKKVYDHMKYNPEDMPKENSVGVKLAEDERYAFFMESTSITYVTQRSCDLMMYGNLLDDKGYGIAMRKNSPYRQKLTTAILKLQAGGNLEILKKKWWEERRGGGQCDNQEESSDATPLGLQNVEGVFWVTIYGVVLSILLVLAEHMLYLIRISRHAKKPFNEVFMLELRYYMNFDSNVKPTISTPEDSKEGSKAKEGSEDAEANKNEEKKRESKPSKESGSNITIPYGFNIPNMGGASPKSNSGSTIGLLKSKKSSNGS